MQQSRSALLTKYHALYEKNPRSRVFAPLAESYRQLGLFEEATSILKKGLAIHPSYPLGHLVMAHCFYDQGDKERCYATLLPFVENNRDNLSLQKLFARTCLELGKKSESLAAYKYLLFLAPKEEEFIKKVKLLESEISESEWASQSDHCYQDNESLEEEWSLIQFGAERTDHGHRAESTSSVETEAETEEQWEMDSPPLETPQALPQEKEKPDAQAPDKSEVPEQESAEEEFVFTHTLVDLYLAQGHRKQAIQVLERLLRLNPGDEKCIERLKTLTSESKSESQSATNESLLDVFDRTAGKKQTRIGSIRKRYQAFLHRINQRAKLKLA